MSGDRDHSSLTSTREDNLPPPASFEVAGAVARWSSRGPPGAIHAPTPPLRTRHTSRALPTRLEAAVCEAVFRYQLQQLSFPKTHSIRGEPRSMYPVRLHPV